MIDLDDDDDDDLQCPLCCEDMDLSDRNFLPCQCGYRVSRASLLRFCAWRRRGLGASHMRRRS